jgi:Zn-dependent protease
MGKSFRIGKIFGIPIYLHFTWFIIFALITVTLARFIFPADYSLWVRVMGGMITCLFFFASVIAHELAHSRVAIRNGIPVKSITLFIFGGVAQIGREATRPGAEFKIAIAGPLCSIALAGFFTLIWFLFQPIFQSPLSISQSPLFWLMWINLLLALFNLIPGFPLDGGRVFRAILWRATGNYRRATHIASLTGRGIAYLFIFVGISLIFIQIFNPSSGSEGLAFNGLWLAFIGWFLQDAATTSYRQTEMRYTLQTLTAGEAMISDYPHYPPPTLTLQQLVQSYILPPGYQYLPVVEEGKLKGGINLVNIKSVPQQHWGISSVAQVMIPSHKLVTACPEESALSLLERMEEQDIYQVLVVKEDRVLGIITRDYLLHFIRVRSELGR